MPEAIRAFAHLALEQSGCYRVEATCDVENVRSAKTLEKCGFIKEGRMARYIIHPNISSEPRDCLLYAAWR